MLRRHRLSCALVLLLSAAGCDPVAAVPAHEIDATALVLDREAGQLLSGGHPFSGTVVYHDDDGVLTERAGFLRGRRHGLRERLYPDGTPSERTVYVDGRRHGAAWSWWQDGTLRSESRFVHGTADGMQRQWYRTGELFKARQLRDGQEEGLQQAWRQNGALYINYEARDGRAYGLQRAALCFGLEDEELIRDDI